MKSKIQDIQAAPEEELLIRCHCGADHFISFKYWHWEWRKINAVERSEDYYGCKRWDVWRRPRGLWGAPRHCGRSTAAEYHSADVRRQSIWRLSGTGYKWGWTKGRPLHERYLQPPMPTYTASASLQPCRYVHATGSGSPVSTADPSSGRRDPRPDYPSSNVAMSGSENEEPKLQIAVALASKLLPAMPQSYGLGGEVRTTTNEPQPGRRPVVGNEELVYH